MLVRIYQAEKDAGIGPQMDKAGNSLFVTAQVQVGDIESVAELVKSTPVVQTVEELLGKAQPDLALIVAILVSTGWNLNDDIFTPEEVWKAKSSPLHKPMNDNHQADKILGHIVQTRALDKSGNEIEIADDESPPVEFDIEVAGVLYKAFPELSERIDEIITKAKAGEMFVSMEAWFPDFGYGLIDPVNGNINLIERTEATAFLTKHLRAYKGSGEYQGYKVGRVLKDIIFGAQGFVDIPANPESVIKVAANQVAASSVFVTAKLSDLSRGGVEDVDAKEIKELQTELEEAQASIESRTKEVAELQKATEEFEAKDYDGQITALNTKVDELTASVTKASEKMVVVEAEKVELQKQFDKVTERADKSEAELDGIRKTETARNRLSQLSKVKKIEDEEATIKELREMTEETFAVVLKYAGETKTEEVSDENKTAQEQAEAILKNAEEENVADLNAAEAAGESEKEKWVSMANKLCEKEDKENEGGE